MRIIGGKFKGRRIVAPKKLPIRPTTDFAKEALFNILNNQLNFEETSALDLFSGSGNISFELLSRETKQIIAVDQNYLCTKFISEESKKLEAGKVKCVKSEAIKFLNRCEIKFDLIFADPPYDYTLYTELINAVFSNNLLSPDGLFVLEHYTKTNVEHPKRYNTRNYSGVSFSMFDNK